MFGKKSKFQGKPRTLNDPKPEKKAPPQPKIPAQETAPVPPPQKKEPEAPPPGPENRSIKATSYENKAAVTPSTIPDDDYEMSRSDVKGLRVGANVAPKTFASVNAKQTRAPSLIANIRFQIQDGNNIRKIEAKFQTSEKLSALYEFLEKEVFDSVGSFEIRKMFPNQLIPRDNAKTLASQKLSGQVMVNVTIQGNTTFK
ncbi:hypothetical protein GPJ56_000561 [Histomonas meleagridis]|uniref:uncharacterized protein n=1 Tax=Histomonas meleagridis TaxID=135588 RepID=UPI00355A201F|nr:hypothetical protein GPJ56_000561 [Histomonas meleagridis]KAH0796399.1 hypothetical protein GO595_010292 [Histomonas meleagridis]